VATTNAARSSRLALVLTLPIVIVACGLWLDDEARIERAQVALDNQQYSAAVIDLKTVLRKAPDNAVARKLLGRALAASGEFEAAEKHLQRALDQGQPLDDFRLVLAEARLGTGQPEQALDIADPTAAADDKEAFFLWLYRGDAQAELGGIVDALRSYEQAERLDIDKATALLRAAELYWGAGNLGDAKAFTESALLDDPGNLDAHLTLGAILLELENWQEAEEKLTHTLTALPLDPVGGATMYLFPRTSAGSTISSM
jgi:tetratricopeptide (TPR) repeat protein